MTDLGTSTWGVILSEAQSSGPSGDKIYWLCDDFKRDLKTKDETSHYASQTPVTIPLGQCYYVANINKAIYKEKTFASLNSHHAKIQSYIKGQTGVYLWVKDSAGTYLDWIRGTTTTDYLYCVLKECSDQLSHGKFMATFRVEETA